MPDIILANANAERIPLADGKVSLADLPLFGDERR